MCYTSVVRIVDWLRVWRMRLVRDWAGKVEEVGEGCRFVGVCVWLATLEGKGKRGRQDRLFC